MAFTAQDVKQLREKTGCGMMDCKKALSETNGNMDAAVDYLREKGLAAATKKSGRIAAEGLAVAYTNESGSLGVVIEVNSETDFVANNADFQNFVKLCAETVMDNNPSDVESLLKMNAKDSSQTVEALLQDKILTIGENIKIRRFQRFEGTIASYIHAGGKIGVLVNFKIANNGITTNDKFKIFAKDVAMQIAAVNPLYLNKENVPKDVVEHEKKILKEQIIGDGKPENIAEKIVMGRIGKYFKEICLLEQPFVKDSGISIAGYVQNIAKELGTEIKILEFARFEKGQGIEKKEDNFAEEVAQLSK